MDEIKKDFDFTPVTLDDYDVEFKDGLNGFDVNSVFEIKGKYGLNYNGDLAKVLRVEDYNEQIPVFKKIKNINYQVLENDKTGKGIITENKNADMNVLVLRDSFTNDMIPFISESFGYVHYLWYRTVPDMQDYIIENKPDIVIEEALECLIDRPLSQTPKLKEVK